MKVYKHLLAAIALSTIAFSADAIIARRDVRTVTQPDGTTLRVRLIGDEASHFLLTEDGNILFEENGLYTFGKINDKGHVVSTGVSATDKAVKADIITNIKDVDIDAVEAKRGANVRRLQSFMPYGSAELNAAIRGHKEGMSRAPQTGVGLVSSTYPRTGSPKGLIILVQYKDVSFTHENPAKYFGDMINKKGFNDYGANGSALEYFTEQSGGKFVPSFDVYGPVTLSNNRSYYGGNDSGGDDKAPHLMVTEACRKLDATVDFSKYDTDGDGLVDNVFVFYAGQGEADGGPSESVWPHSWDVRAGGSNVNLDGVQIAHYACSNEWDTYNRRPDGPGTFIHEFSHVMGLPDLYSTGYQQLTCTPGSYSVLDYGPYNNDGLCPPNYGAYERNAMGWHEPIMLDGPMTVSLDAIPSNDFGLIPTSSKNEFFLLENRQQEGWDAYIPGHGLLIWHIDYNASIFSSNTVNNAASHQYVDIEEANGSANNGSITNMQGWPFPGTKNKTEFTSSTTPALKTWAGTAIDLPVTNIAEDSYGIITFDVAGGGSTLDAPVASANTPASADRHFIASWDAVPGATDYFITVTAGESAPGGDLTNAFDGTALPDGWSTSMTSLATYTTSGNYGSASPSLKFSSTGQWLMSPAAPSDITKIAFWNKGQTTASGGVVSGTSLKIEGLVDGKWVEIENYIPTNMKAVQEELSNIPAGVRQVRFTFNKDKGNIALDDIVISYGGKSFVLPDYNEASTGGATTYRVDKLADGYDTYTFTVRATDGKVKSAHSNAVTVTVHGMSGVEDIIAGDDTEAPVRYFNLQGIEVDKPAPGTIIIERRGNSARKVIVK